MALVATAFLTVQAFSSDNYTNSAGFCVSHTLMIFHDSAADVVPFQCQSLKQAGISNILYPDTESYENRTLTYWSVSAQLDPWCIAQPTSVQEVSVAITTLSQNTTCQFAVRSGGHMICESYMPPPLTRVQSFGSVYKSCHPMPDPELLQCPLGQNPVLPPCPRSPPTQEPWKRY